MIRATQILTLGFAALIAHSLGALPLHAESNDRPNIVYILADDMGYGDLGCYGQKQLTTPNIDRLAKEGLRFTRHYAGSTVCAPSRCVLMTGLHTGHCRVRGNGPGALTMKDVTFASVLRASGYATGCFGKWGIGNPPPLDDPQRHGFDEFYGYINMFHAHNYFPEFLIRNGKKQPLRNRLYADWAEKRTGDREGAGVAEVAVDYAPKLIGDAALQFIREHHQQPFMLYYALNIPHANNEAGGEARVQRNGMRVPSTGNFAAQEWPIQERGFAQMMTYIDQDVGRILELLDELKIADKTLVMFSSDNGPHAEGGHRADFFDSNGPLRGKKRDLYEGGVRVPMIAWWPKHVPAGKTTELISGFQDVFPTVLDVAKIESQHDVDGISMLPTLLGRMQAKRHAHLYWEFLEQGGKRSVLEGNWKGVQRNTAKAKPLPIELYDLSSDPAEENDVAAQHPDRVERLRKIMDAEHRDL